ncbi:hypothetical protein ACFE04_008845 [Oxalis oulophora]
MRGLSYAADYKNRPSTSSSSSSSSALPLQMPNHNHQSDLRRSSESNTNVFLLLARREVSPQAKRSPKRLWRKPSKQHSTDVQPTCEPVGDPKRGLVSWVEAESLRHLSSKYCPLSPPPRSTIAASFSPDGRTLASTHGDHTVKIIDWQSGSCLKVLGGHRRTPWVVRFHPLSPEILASGSLDHEVCLWDAKSAECIGSHTFYRPIASIAFHAHGDLLAVASGHKLFMWQYNKRDNKREKLSPAVVLRTRKSLRAVHFHPYAAPFLLTAEVNELVPSESSITLATSSGYLSYPPPTVYVADTYSAGRYSYGDEQSLGLPFFVWSTSPRDDEKLSLHHNDRGSTSNHTHQRVDRAASVRLLTYSTPAGQYELLLSPVEPNGVSSREEESRTTGSLLRDTDNEVPQFAMDTAENMDKVNYLGERGNHTDSTAMSVDDDLSSVPRSSNSRNRLSTMSANGSGEVTYLNNVSHNISGSQHVLGRIQSELATSMAMAAAAELPCTVKLRIWSHDVKDPSAPLDVGRCLLTIPHAVLCSEMGAHFSPCGKFLAACVPCTLPRLEADPGLQSHDNTGMATSPTQHSVSAHRVMYELRIYSLEEATFGSVLASRPIRAAHCLTSIQFSPTSEHILLAYGRRHSSLLKSVFIDGETTVPVYTILEVYRISDMDLVRVISSAEDEVNVACFHPSVGSGIVYGTKEGKLRILQHEGSSGSTHSVSSFLDENMLQVTGYWLKDLWLV